MVACRDSSIEIVKLFLSHPSLDVNIKDKVCGFLLA
jgi:hypothetical protein